MKISKRAKKTMPQSWIDFFDEAKKWHYSKYFEDDGYQCTAYEPEHDPRRVVQIAERRYRGAASSYFRDRQRDAYSKILGKDSFVVFIAYVTGSDTHGGIYLWDVGDMALAGYTKKKDLVPRGANLYHEIPLDLCKKACDVWEIPYYCTKEALYKCAIWQYQDMTTRKADTGKCSYDKVKTWEDLEDWCFWKYMNPDGSVIEGREEAFEAYKAKSKRDARYIPRYDEWETKDE